ncbi:MAG: NAD-dependent 4,6-dehydratase LegB [Desulfarculaceae bacterium]|nr:NAD-dependent 4,6-dehydratase LegB [Desulfarculaceae bacterium]MCF8072112.1 NAD-dependent 4,6-dehydratase LegB [Desulfarculaceae bacterium]MCF8100033.1 NAD-dependent 4,6-dehydratase LegB [Desulfarculaceae bacterium]
MGFWQDRPVLVTGGDGFIGSHLVERLAGQGARVRAFALYNSFGAWGWLDELPEAVMQRVEIFPGDIRDPNRVSEAVAGQEMVFHLASLIAIPYSYHAPDSYVQTNVGGALNVLNACRAHGAGRLVHTSTSEVYGSAQYVPIDEKHPLQGQSPYSASKIGADMLAESYWRSFELPVATIRPFNTFGPRQSARAVIPTIISQLLAGADELKLGSLTPTRDFNYVADTVEGFLAVARADQAVGQVINVGSGREIAIGDLASAIMAAVGREVPIITEQARLRPQGSEVDRLLCDNSRAGELTGWQPSHSLEQGLAATVEWIKGNMHHFRPQEYSI